MMQYLPDDILTKVDRASMAVSLEVRVPLLDHRVVEFSWRLPRSALIHGRRGKQILRNVLHRYVPPALVERPKAGFAVPIGDWIRGPLAGWASDLLSRPSLAASGLLNSNFIEQRFAEHQSGRRDWSHDRKTAKAQNDESRCLIDGRRFPFFEENMRERYREYQKAHNAKFSQKPDSGRMNNER